MSEYPEKILKTAVGEILLRVWSAKSARVKAGGIANGVEEKPGALLVNRVLLDVDMQLNDEGRGFEIYYGYGPVRRAGGLFNDHAPEGARKKVFEAVLAAVLAFFETPEGQAALACAERRALEDEAGREDERAAGKEDEARGHRTCARRLRDQAAAVPAAIKAGRPVPKAPGFLGEKVPGSQD